jgi:hypothetical protein
VVSNLTKRLDRLERLIRERTAALTAPLYLRDGEPIPEGIEPERVVFIVRTFVEPPERGEEALPVIEKPEERPARVERREPISYPDYGFA